MDLETAEAILRGTGPASYTMEELGEAEALVLAELDRLRGQAAGWVVVTIAPNNGVHAYGHGTGQALPTLSLARSLARQLVAADQERYPNDIRVQTRICKVLGDQP